MIFLPTYMQFNGQKFSNLSEKLSFNPHFFGLKMQKSAFLKKNGFECSCYQINEQLVINWSSRLNKHETLEILIKIDYKISNFSRFLKFTSRKC